MMYVYNTLPGHDKYLDKVKEKKNKKKVKRCTLFIKRHKFAGNQTLNFGL